MISLRAEQISVLEQSAKERFLRGLRMHLAQIRPESAQRPVDEIEGLLARALAHAQAVQLETRLQAMFLGVLCYDFGDQFWLRPEHAETARVLTNVEAPGADRLERVAADLCRQTRGVVRGTPSK